MANDRVPMPMSGFCTWPGLDNAHRYCKTESCTCSCHEEEEA